MNRLPLATLALASLFAFAVHAQGLKLPDAKPAEAKQEPSAAPAPGPGPGQEPDPKIIEEIMACLAPGLSEDWKRTWIVIREANRDKTGKERLYVGTFHYATDDSDLKGKWVQPCSQEKIVEGVGKLNAYLPGNQQRWTAATFTFYRDGRFQASYDYTLPKPAAKPAAKPAPKKKQEAAK